MVEGCHKFRILANFLPQSQAALSAFPAPPWLDIGHLATQTLPCYYFYYQESGFAGVDMHTIEDVPNNAFTTVQALARAWKITEGAVVARLVEHFVEQPASEQLRTKAPGSAIPIYVVYDTTRIDATFDPATKSVTITSGKLKDRAFASPSGAAVAVVSAYNPSVNPNRNGWSFWFLAESGELLQTVRK
jgi:hypothetical protein